MKKLFYLYLLLMVSASVSAQIAIDTAYFSRDSITGFYYPKVQLHPDDVFSSTSTILKSIPNYSFQKGQEFSLEGKTYMRYDQYSNGVKVNGNSYFVCTQEGYILQILGNVAIDAISAPSGVMSPADVISSLISSLHMYKYKWEDEDAETTLQEQTGDPSATYYPTTALSIYKKYSTDFNHPSDYYYAYPIYISALANEEDSLYFDSLYYVNPIDGSILFAEKTYMANEVITHGNSDDIDEEPGYSIQETADATGSDPFMFAPAPSCNNSCNPTGVTVHYYGGQNINSSEFVYQLLCTNRLKQNCNGAVIYTRKEVFGFSVPHDYRSNNNSWPNGADKVGITGHWCLEKTYETFQNMYNFNSYNNAYSQANLVVARQTFGSSWSTSIQNVGNSVLIGKFPGTASYEVTLDIVGHEFSHGIMKSTSGLGNGNPNPNTLQALWAKVDEQIVAEGFGDIFGQLVEYYTNQNYSTTTVDINDFVQGGNRPGGFLCGSTRSAINPGATCNAAAAGDGNWVNSSTLTLSSSANDIEALPHTDATVISRWFYLLAQGGSGTNTIGNNYCVSGIGQGAAGNIAFLTATNYIGGVSKTILGARMASVSAADQIYGVGSNESAQVQAAWYAVGIGTTYAGPRIIQNITINTAKNYNYNAEVQMKNVVVAAGPLDVSSSTKVNLYKVKVNSGVVARFYLAPSCAGGAVTEHNPGNDYETTGPTNGGAELPNTAAGINKPDVLKNMPELTVMPNPNNGTFKLILDQKGVLPNEMTIVDLLGRSVFTISNPERYQYDVNLGNVPSGVFILKVSYPDQVITKRLIKN